MNIENKDWQCRFDDKEMFLCCKGMSAMMDSVGVSGIGAHIAHVINFNTMKESDMGVYYKFTKQAIKDNGLQKVQLMFNVCPFCKAEILRR